ncbi:hypothetical protein GQ54DRAFT_299621 [Martensiomyces pterosporus]|nr:hypothetical protein GQ54DRAFT_299621 [Martensiomyces pterosporus]
MVVPSAGNRQKLRILCLHGYEQDASIFRAKLKCHVSDLEDKAELVFATAPNTLRPYDLSGMDNLARIAAARAGSTISRIPKGWYIRKSADPEIVDGLDNSIAYLEAVLEEQGPFDGVLGFSQGGLMAAVMCSLLEHRYEGLSKKCTHPPFKFAIVSSGYKLKDKRWAHLYSKPIHTPSLHMYGVLDSMIRISSSMALQEGFVQPASYSFVGGHYVPKSRQSLRTVSEFISQFAA